ncbi:hypothetical protein CON36_35310 [Bacillus cereus]|uniref:Uncharacterized protein n=1 Tax=Bacillus cereus TaxID=1396 RepID=A0A9X6SSF9_BACCE|nr:hypothetical protein [Bacillus cereus]PDZ94156.1 hypothetical protein CON36_35310 [Bacillus cereus]
MSVESIKELILNQVENIAVTNRYDMVYEQNDENQLLVQILKRDQDGGILGTPLSFDLHVNEDKGDGEFIFYHAMGEFKRQKFNVFQEGSLLEVLTFINGRLSINEF